MYCFPDVTMPEGALREAKKQGITPNTLYCMSLLQATGICVVPASGFGQKQDRYGFQTTFLSEEKDMELAVHQMKKHYASFCSQYAS